MSAKTRLIVAALALLLMWPAALSAQTTRVSVILTNDIYSMGETLMPDGQRRGGFARLAAVVKAERAKGGHVLFAHGGDTLSPSLMSGIDRGAHIITLTNLIPPDVFVPGNHEFDFGKAVFAQRMAEARFPIYAANLRGPDGAPLPHIRDRDMLTFDGVRIGVTGAAYDDTPRASSSEDLRFAPTVATAQAQSRLLRQEGADLVVAVMHADRSQGIELAASGDADVILTGHNHDLFISYDGKVAMAESTSDAHLVTIIDLAINVTEADGKRVTTWWPSFRIVDTATVTPDPEVAAVVAGFEAELAREMDVPLATTAIALDSRNAIVRTREAAIGSLIADAMRERTGAEIAVTNGGGIRAGRVYPAGSAITRRDVLAEMPFGNRVMEIELTGAALREALENGFSRLPEAAGRFPQVSGLAITLDPRRPPGQRIVTIEAGGAPLDPARVYKIATNEFLARGGDGYASFAEAKPVLAADDAPLLANEVMVHLRRLGAIRVEAGRIVVR